MKWANLRQILRMGGIVSVFIVVFSNVGVHAESQLTASVQSDAPEKTTLTLKNTSNETCQLASTATGTVAITKMMQDGQEIKPTLLQSGFDEGLDKTLVDNLQTLKPGQSLTIPLLLEKSGNTTAIQSVVWSDVGDVVMLYQVKPNESLDITLNYSVPVTPQSGASMCGSVTAVSASTNMTLWYGIAGIFIVILLLAIVWFVIIKKRKHKPVVAIVIVIGVAWALWHVTPTANATIVVPPSIQSQWDSCMATLEANRDITGPILDLLNSSGVHVVIDVVNDGDDYTTHWPDGTYHINWDPNHVHRYAGTGGMSDICTTLYHEMDHILQMENGSYSRADCAGSGIETKEVLATREQNRLRVRLGLPPRSHYGTRSLPAGDCSPPSPHKCSGGSCGDSNGDPHLLTFDGMRYDFQAAGEFVLARSKTGDFEIQTRQQPWEDSPYVAVNTAVVMKAGGQKIELQTTTTAMKLLVDGKAQPRDPMTLHDGTALAVADNNVDVTWTDGTVVTVRRLGGYGLDTTVDPSSARSGQLEGLLGDADGDSANDLHLRGKTASIQPTFSSLYPAFADSWRISSSESLFSYASGKSTDSYTNRSFPQEYKAPTALPGYDAAKKLCQQMGVIDEDALANCALDVAITGRPEFAASAAFSQATKASSLTGGTLYTMAIKNPGDSGNVTFTAKAGEKVFVAITSSSLPSQCGSITLRGSDDAELASGCIINHTGEIDTTSLPADGTYTIRMTPNDNGTGDVRLRLFHVTDKQMTVSADGSSHSMTLSTPGMTGRFQFNGTAGQRVFVNVPSSTLPSMCGVLQLVASDGTELSSGCIINGQGNIDTTVLPSTGTYSVVMNPDDVATGTLTVQVISADVVTKTISIGGQTTLNLAKSGDIGQVSFTATAGQRVFIDMTNATLPSQCGGIYVQDSVGISIGACIINGAGSFDGGLLIPATGTYTLIIDPADAATGNVTVKLHT